jgi:predicted ArsR family transcriptional regulator
VLATGGFEPEPTADATIIRLHHCPFRRLAQAQPGVICGVHLGILQGAFEELGAPVTAARLEPFVRPDLCLAQIERRPSSDS